MIQVLHLTDLHITANAGERLRGIDTRESLAAVWEMAQARLPNHDAVLLTGDLTEDGSLAGYEHIREVFRASAVPVLCVPGNHDDPDALRATLCGGPFRSREGVDLGAHWRIELLDTHLPGAVGGRLSADALAVVERLHHEPADRFQLIALHHPPLPMNSAWLDRCGLFDPEALLAAVDGNPQIRAVVWGHAHQAFERQRGHAKMLCTPSTNTQFVPGAPGFATDDALGPGFRALFLSPDGAVASEVHRLAPDAVSSPTPGPRAQLQ